MENSSLNDLFVALSNPEDEIRKQAEFFVLNMINEKEISFIEKILDELVHTNPSINQIWYSFIIIKKCSSFYEDYQKIFDASLKFFGHENEQIRMISVLSYCVYSVKSLGKDQTSLNLILSNIKSSSDFYTIESTIRAISTIVKSSPSCFDLTILIDYLFNFFIQSETIEIDTLLILAINDIIPLISESHIKEGQFIQKLMYLININELKASVFMILRTIVDYFYSTQFLSEVICQILEISCHDLSEINDADTIMRIISFWNEIARIEYDISENESISFHYINSCGEILTPYLVNVLSKRYDDYDSDIVESKTDWKPLQASRETLKFFCLISFNLISPILIQFLNGSDDSESILFVLSIIIQTMPQNNETKSQIPTFLNKIFSEIVSSNVRVRYAALYALNSIVSLDFVQPQEFDPFLEIFFNEWNDIERNACKSFKIFTKICAKMPIEKESEFIIQSLQNIEKMPIQYISFYLVYIEKNNFKEINLNNSKLIYQLITFFSTFLENSLNEYKNYSTTQSIVLILNKFFIRGLNLNSVFSDILNLLMRAFSEYTISFIPIAISSLFWSDTNSSLPHFPAIVEFFISLLNENRSLTIELTNRTTSALLFIIYIDIKNTKIINDVYNCICNLMLRIQEDDNNENFFLINLIFEFFDIFLLIREIDPQIVQNLFKMIRKYASISQIEMHDIVVENPSFYEQILEFIINLISEYPQSLTPEYLEIVNFVINSINSLNYNKKEIIDKINELQDLMLQITQENE